MLFETSTMGTVRESVFDNEYEYAEDIIKGYEGQSEIKDETILPIIYELDNPEEWQDERKWYKANPGLRNKKHKRFTRQSKQSHEQPNRASQSALQRFQHKAERPRQMAII